ncbi:MAG: fic [Subtercola sp.]|nr:fic [Subtercola sp.]
MSGRPDTDATTIAWRVNFAGAVLAYVNVGAGSTAHRELVADVATETITADEAVEETAARHGMIIDRKYRPIIQEFDEYLIPDTPTLKSGLRDAETGSDIIDADRFREVEVEISHIRLIELAISPLIGNFDADHYRAVHRLLFRDIFPWAGDFRIGPETAMIRFLPDAVNFEAGDPAAPLVKYSYYSGPEMADAASVQFAQLAEILRARGWSREVTLNRVAESLGEFHAIHPFRDGNARAFCAFGALFGQRIGYLPDYAEYQLDSEKQVELVHAQLNYQATDEPAQLSQSLINADNTMPADVRRDLTPRP